MVLEAQDLQAQGADDLIALLVVGVVGLALMLRAVELDDKLELGAIEVGDIAPQLVLAPEVEAFELMSA